MKKYTKEDVIELGKTLDCTVCGIRSGPLGPCPFDRGRGNHCEGELYELEL